MFKDCINLSEDPYDVYLMEELSDIHICKDQLAVARVSALLSSGDVARSCSAYGW
jgi:hypothetical protein